MPIFTPSPKRRLTYADYYLALDTTVSGVYYYIGPYYTSSIWETRPSLMILPKNWRTLPPLCFKEPARRHTPRGHIHFRIPV